MKTKPLEFQAFDEASILHIIQASELGNGIDEAVVGRGAQRSTRQSLASGGEDEATPGSPCPHRGWSFELTAPVLGCFFEEGNIVLS